MRHRTLALLVLLAGLTLAGLLLRARRPDAVPGNAPSSVPPAATSSEFATAEAELMTAPPDSPVSAASEGSARSELRRPDGEEAFAGTPLVIEVVDGLSAAPVVGVTVVCGRRAAAGGESRAKTDASGLATFRNAAVEVAQSPVSPLVVRVDLPLADAPEVLVESAPAPNERVRLHLPPVGSVEVRVVHADGSIAADGTEMVLGLQRRITAGDGTPLSIPSRIATATARTEAGRALFEGVALGRELFLAVRGEGRERPHENLVGPERRGERVVHTLVLPAEPAVLVFRALDELGAPVSGSLHLTIGVASRVGSSARFETVHADGRGIFELELGDGLVEGERCQLDVDGRGRSLSGRVDLGRPFTSGRTDAGDVVLRSVPLVAAGRVFDGAGGPVRGAMISAGTANYADIDAGFRQTLLGRRTEPTGEDGAFALHGTTTVTRVRLLLDHDQLRAAPIEIAVGSSGVEIVAEVAGGVAGRVLLDAGASARDLLLSLRLEHGIPGASVLSIQHSRGSSDGKIDEEGRFELRGAVPGAHTFSLATIGGERLEEVAGIRIAPGEIDRDPRLAAIDLRGRLHVFTFELVPPPGATLAGGWISYGAAGSTSRWPSIQIRKNRVIVTTPHESIDVLVRADGFRIERLSGPSEHTEIRLRPGLTVRLVLPSGVDLPAAPLFVGATLVGDDANRPTPRAFFDDKGEILCHVAEPGRMKVRWIVERRHDGGSSGSGLDMPAEQVVVVDDVADEQRFELVVTNEALAAALAAR